MPGFIYKPDTHEYSLDGHLLPSVTSVLSTGGLMEKGWWNEEARWRGSDVHEAIRLDNLGDLDEASVTDEVRGYLESWRKVRAELSLGYLSVEVPSYHRDLLYAGTPDLGSFIGTGKYKGCHAVVDYKTSASIARWVRIQLAAYSRMLGFGHVRIAARLRADGEMAMLHTYPPEETAADFAVFEAALRVWRWKEER